MTEPTAKLVLGWARALRQRMYLSIISPEGFEERQELPPALALADPVEHLPGGQVQGGEHVPHPAGAPVGSPQPGGAGSGPPGFAGAGLQVQWPELIGGAPAH